MKIGRIVLATGNKHKVVEISEILKKFPLEIVPLSVFPDAPEVVEDGATLDDNARKKAVTIARHLNCWVLADDTGLEVACLNGEPGVYSARWAGPNCTYADNNRKMLSMLKGVPANKRQAAFRCVIALASPGAKKVWTVEGSIRGVIDTRLRGAKGFGYDPLFLVPRYGKTFAQLPLEIKNRISHRGKAVAKMKSLIKKLLESGNH